MRMTNSIDFMWKCGENRELNVCVISLFQVWIFGDLWCSIWLAVDVWMCTASILNLCAISLDRYVAVTRPVTYPSIMSTKRAKLLVAGVWVLSFVICLPQLVGLTQNHKVSESNMYLHAYTVAFAWQRFLLAGLSRFMVLHMRLWKWVSFMAILQFVHQV